MEVFRGFSSATGTKGQARHVEIRQVIVAFRYRVDRRGERSASRHKFGTASSRWWGDALIMPTAPCVKPSDAAENRNERPLLPKVADRSFEGFFHHLPELGQGGLATHPVGSFQFLQHAVDLIAGVLFLLGCPTVFGFVS